MRSISTRILFNIQDGNQNMLIIKIGQHFAGLFFFIISKSDNHEVRFLGIHLGPWQNEPYNI